MLSDDRLQRLLHDAHTLDTIERAGAAPIPRAPGGRRTRWILAVAAALAMLASVQLVLTRFFVPSNPIEVVDSERLSPKPDRAADPLVAQRPHLPTSSLLLAVYQNAAGSLSCVNWSADALKGRTVASLTTEELTRLGLALACDPEAARILVVGLEGPTAALPSSDARAKLVAQCLSTSNPCASGSFNPTTCASSGCIDTEIKVRIESLALK